MPVLVKILVSLAAALTAVGAGVLATTGGSDPAAVPRTKGTTGLRVEVVDGDTVRLPSGLRVRLIGINAPDKGECGDGAATAKLHDLVDDQDVTLPNPDSVNETDKWGRLLRYVEVRGGVDTGYILVKSGLAQARYDSRDGYDAHPRENQYRRADSLILSKCPAGEKRERADWRRARDVADDADIRVRDDETATQLLHRAERVLHHRAVAAERAAKRAAAARAAREARKTGSSDSHSSPERGFTPPAGWTTDALTPGYTGCRQGYPGGSINGVYVWRPIDC